MKWLRRYGAYIALLLLLSLNLVVILERQNIGDWLKLRNYTAPSNVAALAIDDTMTPYAKKLFYVNHPVLEGKEAFNGHCADLDAETAVLGCFHGDRLGIFVYDVQDERLHGVQQVTAAHEMLHQAYERLSSKERQHMDHLLNDFYTTKLNDADIKAKIDTYRKQKGVVLTNEMHSIFGTEVRNLTPELETYYTRYFTSRVKIVAYSEAYQGEFKRRKDLVDQYDTQLTNLKGQIDANKSDLDSRSKALHSKENEINQDTAARNLSEYQNDVQDYNQQVSAYNAKITATRKLIDNYNSIVAARNEIATQEQQLQKALDSRLSPAETQ